VATVLKTFRDSAIVTAAGQPGPNLPSADQGEDRDREAPEDILEPVTRRRHEKTATRLAIESPPADLLLDAQEGVYSVP
jgi:hypothetical protein